MKTAKILTVLTVFLLIFSLAACGTSKGNKKDDGNKKAEIAALIAMEPGTKDEATALHQKLMEQENAILSENSELWEKVFLSANKPLRENLRRRVRTRAIRRTLSNTLLFFQLPPSAPSRQFFRVRPCWQTCPDARVCLRIS